MRAQQYDSELPGTLVDNGGRMRNSFRKTGVLGSSSRGGFKSKSRKDNALRLFVFAVTVPLGRGIQLS